MWQSSGESCGPDFHLPDEIPTDPYDQLDLARKVTSMPIASRVPKPEAETERMHQKLEEKDRVICERDERLSRVQKYYQEADSKLKMLVDDNLEWVKKQMMQSLNDDNSSAEAVDIGTCDPSSKSLY